MHRDSPLMLPLHGVGISACVSVSMSIHMHRDSPLMLPLHGVGISACEYEHTYAQGLSPHVTSAWCGHQCV